MNLASLSVCETAWHPPTHSSYQPDPARCSCPGFAVLGLRWMLQGKWRAASSRLCSPCPSHRDALLGLPSCTKPCSDPGCSPGCPCDCSQLGLCSWGAGGSRVLWSSAEGCPWSTALGQHCWAELRMAAEWVTAWPFYGTRACCRASLCGQVSQLLSPVSGTMCQ